MLQHIIFDVVVHTFFNVAVLVFLRCCSTYFFDVALHILCCCGILQFMFFNVEIHIFAILQYLQSNVALYKFSIYFCNVAVEMFHAHLGQGHGGE